MRTASRRVISQDDLALEPTLAKASDLELDGILHAPQMNRYVWGVCHKMAVRIEESAGEVQSLLDVRACRCSLQRDAHLLCN